MAFGASCFVAVTLDRRHEDSEVVVEGKLINRNYTDKSDVKRYVTEIHVSDLVIVSHGKK